MRRIIRGSGYRAAAVLGAAAVRCVVQMLQSRASSGSRGSPGLQSSPSGGSQYFRQHGVVVVSVTGHPRAAPRPSPSLILYFQNFLKLQTINHGSRSRWGVKPSAFSLSLSVSHSQVFVVEVVLGCILSLDYAVFIPRSQDRYCPCVSAAGLDVVSARVRVLLRAARLNRRRRESSRQAAVQL